MQTGTITRVNTSSSGQQANDWTDSEPPALSDDGRYAVFGSLASNLVAGDKNGKSDIFLKDLQTNKTIRVNVDSESNPITFYGSYWPKISADGRYVSFYSVLKDPTVYDIGKETYVKHRLTGVLVALNSPAINEYNVNEAIGFISRNGRYVAFNVGIWSNGNLMQAYQKDLFTESSPAVFASNYYNGDNVLIKWRAGNYDVNEYSYVLNRSNLTHPDTKTEGKAASKKFKNKANGRWYFHIRSNGSKNASANGLAVAWGPAFHRQINIDTYKPKTFAPRKANIKKNKKGRIYYKVFDPYTGGKARVTLVIKNKKNKVVKKIKLGLIKINNLKSYLFKGSLPFGEYTFSIYAKDQSGNSQRNIATNRLTIN